MNWTIIIIETLVLTAAFTAMILIPLVKNPVWWIADYPEDIQEEYFKTHERIPSKFFTPTVLLKKGMALLIALALLLLVVKLAGAYDFWSALGVGYGIWLLRHRCGEAVLATELTVLLLHTGFLFGMVKPVVDGTRQVFLSGISISGK